MARTALDGPAGKKVTRRACGAIEESVTRTGRLIQARERQARHQRVEGARSLSDYAGVAEPFGNGGARTTSGRAMPETVLAVQLREAKQAINAARPWTVSSGLRSGTGVAAVLDGWQRAPLTTAGRELRALQSIAVPEPADAARIRRVLGDACSALMADRLSAQQAAHLATLVASDLRRVPVRTI